MALSDDYPVLLGPVRIETAFTATELLIRVFPDEWSIDKFEPRPTQAELSALNAYWTALWRARGNPAGEEAAWHELTARIPAGRASWLLQPDQHHQPANLADKPAGVPQETVVLVIVSNQALPANDRQPTITYWTAVWRAHGDRIRIRDADIALLAAVGATRAAAIRSRPPVGVDAAPVASGNEVLVSYLVLPQPAAADIAPQSWTQAATARLLPDRFTVLGYVGGLQVLSATGATIPATLAVSPEPGAADQLEVNEQTGVLHVPGNLRWLTGFDRAVQVGMGLRIPLTDPIRNGLDRLVVLGLRQQAAPEQAAADLAALITRQLRSPAGFALLPQGTPTNNTEQRPAGQDATAEAAAGLRTTFGFAARAARAASAARADGITDSATDWAAKTDGQWFAELLGVDPAVLTGMPNADGHEQRDTRAMNVALWPATWGNFLQTTLHPILTAQAVRQTRDFFVRYVSGRGPLPAVKVGRQPYGILPTTAFSRLAWPDGIAAVPAAHRQALHKVLTAAAEDWQKATAKVARLRAEPDPADDPHQTLLDVLALHPTSAEYHQRYAQSVEDIFNRENLGGLGETVLPALDDVLHMPEPIHALLARFGFHVDPDLANRVPDLVRRLFVGTQYPLLAPLVDDRPLSETEPVHGDYLKWLADHAGTDLETIRLETGFAGNRPPAALLYLFLRHAVLLGWIEAGRLLAIEHDSAVIPSTADPLFVNVKFADPPESLPSESRFHQLYSPDEAITEDSAGLVHQHIPGVVGQSAATAQLAEQVAALGLLTEVPTARLERAFAEHLDCAIYRLDAWRLGLANERLAQLRYGPGGTGPAKRGLHIGAYGWLEEVKPRTKDLTPVPLTGPLAQVFAGPEPLSHDAKNGGYVHAPSPGHATTAAVLRAGYVGNRPPGDPGADPGPFAVNLSSERVRVALGLLDGMRQGQSLGALLGYRFERGLHEDHPEVELDRFIPFLRAAFPLRAGRLPGATPGPDTSIELIEARTVVDGLALVRRANRPPHPAPLYPYGADDLLPADATDDEKDAMNAEVQRLLDINDALADLAVAEGTHQALLGNPERASATLDAYAKEGLPPDPAVVQTPRSGVTLTHRLAVHFHAGLHPSLLAGPRAKAEPAVNDWLPGWLPKPQDVVAKVTWTDPAGGEGSRVVSQSDLDLQPIDLLWAVRPAGDPAMTELDDRVIGYVVDRSKPRPDAALTINYTKRVTGKVTFFELSPLIDALRTLLTTSRPTRPTDLIAAAGAATVDRAADAAVSLPKERPVAVQEALEELREDVAEYLEDLAPLYPAEPAPPKRPQLISGIDTFLGGYAELIVTAAGFGMVRSGWGEVIEWRRGVFADVLKAVADTAERMGNALGAADALIAQYEALPPSAPAEEKFRPLEQAERLLTAKPTIPRPATPEKLRTIVKNRRKTFNDKLQDLLDEAETSVKTLSALLAEVDDLLPLTDLDPTGLDLTPFGDRVVAYGRDLLDRATALQGEIDERLATAATALGEYDKAMPGPDRVQAATEALTALLGADVLAIPEFTVPEQLATEWKKARGDSDKLIRHLGDDHDRDFPVDDWLHGMARVREKPRLWEKAVLLSDALRDKGGVLGDQPDPALVPIQLPYRANDHWLGMEFASGTKIAEDRLLFTAYYTTIAPVLSSAPHAGLLLDEWTEVIPADRETTGIAVNYDRPDAEPPQAMLLVTPPVTTGTWNVDDLIAAVHETFEMAKSRAVEPEHLDDTAYAQLLPATVMSATRQPITISTDLAIANLRWKAP